jgi:hypothetical protein
MFIFQGAPRNSVCVVDNPAKFLNRSWDRSVTRPRAWRPEDRSSIPGSGRDFSLHHPVETGSVAHPASYPLVRGYLTPQSGRCGKLTTDSHAGASSCVIISWCLIKQRDNFIVYCLKRHRCLGSVDLLRAACRLVT